MDIGLYSDVNHYGHISTNFICNKRGGNYIQTLN